MSKTVILIWFTISLTVSCFGQGNDLLKTVSPKLKQFLARHPDASQQLLTAISQSFSNRTAQIYYFYSTDEARPRALHYYPNESVVGIAIRENQEPVDEYICLLFETINSLGEKQFKELAEQAKAGAVSKTEFARSILRQEFQAVRRVRQLLDDLKLGKIERNTSHYFKKFSGCPDDFEQFLTYKSQSTARDASKEYEQTYDLLRKAQ